MKTTTIDYDVFISCKSEDYDDARQIYNYLTKERNYNVFLVDEELRKKSQFQYSKVIDLAIASADHMIVFTSKAEYVVTTYVESEWRLFVDEQRTGRKVGNLLTVLKGVKPADLPDGAIALRNVQSIPFEKFKGVEDYLPKLGGGKVTKERPKTTSSFKFYSTERCDVYREGKLIGTIEGGEDVPCCISVSQRGDYRFRVVNSATQQSQIVKASIGVDECKEIDVQWNVTAPVLQQVADNKSDKAVGVDSKQEESDVKLSDVLIPAVAVAKAGVELYKSWKQTHSAKRYNVGDYYDDGTKQGVVFEVSDGGRHGKIVSLMESSEMLRWAIESVYRNKIGTQSPTNGADNMKKVQTISGWRDKYPAFRWCADLGEGWYLPAIEELDTILRDESVYEAVNATLEARGATQLPDVGELYWSSTECHNEFCAWSVTMGSGYTDDYGKYNSLCVRAVSAF